jgi:2-phospho-L-lactate/phosphoenolpyruvate guanylyltransferase
VRTAAILPVKRFEQAKRRLGASVADPLRVELARAMVADVLLALAQTAAIERTIVVTREPSVASAARELDATVVEDDGKSGQSAAALLGVRRALAEGVERALCVPGDCPALDPAELEGLLHMRPEADQRGQAGRGGESRGAAREVVVVPDRHGTGTNGLLLTPPDAIAPAFGPGSCERHRALALAAGVAFRVEHPPSLLLDIDTGADLALLRERLAGHTARAAHTRSVLGQPERTDILTITNSR